MRRGDGIDAGSASKMTQHDRGRHQSGAVTTWRLAYFVVLVVVVSWHRVAASGAADAHMNRFDPVLSHYQSQGVTMDGVAVYHSEERGFGLRSTKNLESDHAVLRIPEHQILSLARAGDSAFAEGLEVLDALGLSECDSFWGLAAMWMFERHQPLSKWHWFFQYLPVQSIEQLPLHFEGEAVESLYTHARDLVAEIQDQVDYIGRALLPKLAQHNPEVFYMFSNDTMPSAFHEWRLAIAAVWSRSFLLEIDSTECWGLVPVAGWLVRDSSCVCRE